MNKVTDVVKEGDKVKVKLLGMDERGKVRLSMKAVDQATGEDLEAKGQCAASRCRRRGGVIRATITKERAALAAAFSFWRLPREAPAAICGQKDILQIATFCDGRHSRL